jgi:hypothetical protein
MFRDWFRSKSLSVPLRPAGGEIYAHVFENPRTGVRRNLFWNISVEFEPVRLDGEVWDCSFGVEWLTWPIPTWRALDGMDVGKVVAPEMVESSLYLLAEHHPATLRRLRLTAMRGSAFEAAITASAQVRTDHGSRTVPVSCVCTLPFTGIIVVSGNLEPKPDTAEEAGEAAAQFIGMDGLREPRSEGWRYIFEPMI